LLSPPKELKEKYVHTFYIVGMVTLSMIFLYLIYGARQELAESQARIEEKTRHSAQAAAVVRSLPSFNGSDTFRAIILASFSFLEKWKSEFPETLAYARSFLNKKEVGSYECQKDSESMKAFLKGIAA
jgi:hypothetical protein